jgi:hypothetical protein
MGETGCVSEAEWDSTVQAMELTVKADDVLNELCGCEYLIDAAVEAGRLDLIGTMYGSVRLAYAERLAWRELHGSEPIHLPTSEQAAAIACVRGACSVLTVDQVAAMDDMADVRRAA